MICWGKSLDAAYNRTHSYHLLQWKDTKQNQQEESSHGFKSIENHEQLTSKSPLQWITWNLLNSFSNKLWQYMRNIVHHGSSLERLSAQRFTGGWSLRHPLPRMYQKLRFPERRQAFSVDHTVGTNSLGPVCLLKSKLRHASQEPTLRSGPRPAICSFLHI